VLWVRPSRKPRQLEVTAEVDAHCLLLEQTASLCAAGAASAVIIADAGGLGVTDTSGSLLALMQVLRVTLSGRRTDVNKPLHATPIQ
jgi:hypothetical protein